MERRKFLKATTIASSCVLAGTKATGKAMVAEIEKDYHVKITVLKRSLNKEWSKELRGTDGEKCNLFKEGQEFLLKSEWSAPSGFCHWAWADIRTFIQMVNDGKFDTFVSCCTDGFRPVFFKIERLE